ncbi:MAG: hypothetical protein EOO01_07700 [Chitinophagaceae bacterium]|nr:MAG: hypothetical protein EOO01_07700 [Chitinophagaceae bacterium]
MKIGQLIVQYLYNNKEVTLQEIGTFTLSKDIVFPAESDKEAFLPDNAVQFQYNTRAGEDEGLIDYIVQTTRKIRPLAKSDLESYAILGREYLNIGKPFPIEGLGTLQKADFGGYEFVQGHSINPKLESQVHTLKEKEENVINFSTPARARDNRKNWMIGIGTLLLLLLVTAAIFYLFREKKPVDQSTSVILQDTIANRDSQLVAQPDTTLLQRAAPVVNDSSYVVAVKYYKTEAKAKSMLETFNGYGYKFDLTPIDSSNYYLTMKIVGARADSTRVLDSLNRLFGVKSFILN